MEALGQVSYVGFVFIRWNLSHEGLGFLSNIASLVIMSFAQCLFGCSQQLVSKQGDHIWLEKR